MANLRGSKYFLKLYLTKGYWQFPIDKPSKPLTVFSAPKGMLQYKVLPFGVKSSPAACNHLVKGILTNVGPGGEPFVDDFLFTLPHGKISWRYVRGCSSG
ncbi:unnamed protein product [Lymnaea stagnalis]|uniref:Reverse transcriptase domain-containing protein n=1 Tax=Lymnaea stagnalis TaxID=6523 RepID=A0AAV2IIW6_LYMST